MADKNELQLIKKIIQSTWSLEEAAHLVHHINPDAHPVPLSPKSIDPVSKTYYWLMKEFGKGRLYSVADVDGTPCFSPGTLMRHMAEKGRYVSAEVRKIYDSASGQPGPAGLSAEAKEIYRAAAILIWKQAPSMPTTKVVGLLEMLPSLLIKNQLSRYASGTLRRWLNGMGPGKVGRPSSKDKASNDIDLNSIAKKLDEY